MGLEKRQSVEHDKKAIFEALGYSQEIIEKELQPRAALLANGIVEVAGICPTMTIELFLDSPILRDTILDNRDRATILFLAGPFVASKIMKELMERPGEVPVRECASKHGFDHMSGKEDREVLRMSTIEWDMLVNYVDTKVLEGAGQKQASKVIENLEQALSDNSLNPLQKAVVEAFVLRTAVVNASDKLASPAPGGAPL